MAGTAPFGAPPLAPRDSSAAAMREYARAVQVASLNVKEELLLKSNFEAYMALAIVGYPNRTSVRIEEEFFAPYGSVPAITNWLQRQGYTAKYEPLVLKGSDDAVGPHYIISWSDEDPQRA